jgi:hypothetical protein
LATPSPDDHCGAGHAAGARFRQEQPATLPNPDALNRTAKILIDSGASSFEAAESTIAGWTIQLALGSQSADETPIRSRSGAHRGIE